MKLHTKSDFTALMHRFLDPLLSLYSEGGARLHLGDTGVTYPGRTIEMEAFSRPLWALAPFWTGGGRADDFLRIYRKGLASGTDPESPEYWGDPNDYDQLFVEMAALACAILETPESVWEPLTDDEKRAYSTAANSGLPIIPETTANQIIKKMYEVAPILQRCKIFHVPGNFKFAIEGTNDEAALHTENAAITAASDSLGSVSLTGYEIVKLVKASRACSEMALSAFESYIVEVIAEAVARRIEKYLFTGTGTNQPGGVKTAGKGASGAYTDGTDQITVGKTASLTEENVIALYGLLGDGYERNAVWCMNKATFFSDFFPLMNKSKNNVIEFANGKYYIMGAEVYFTGSLAAHEAYLGDFSYIIGNYSQDITVVRSEHSGLATNSIDYLGACVFDSKPVAGFGAFVHLAKAAD